MADGRPNLARILRGSRLTRRLGFVLILSAVAVGLSALYAYRFADAQVRGKPRPAAIDGDRAYAYLKQICALGPRPAGSEANTRQRKLVADHFQKHGGQVREQTFAARDPQTGAVVQMANLIGSWFPERTERVLITAHYDTRPFPDEETDPTLRKGVFLGANDCASGVALLMEIAHHLGTFDTPWGVDLVLLDGEELVYGRNGEYFLGSKEFGRIYSETPREKRKFRYTYGILLDMVGGRDLQIAQEPYSLDFAPRLVREIWSVADQLGERAFRPNVGRAVLDDHLALNRAGIPTIDIIDFEYPFWHTVQDTPENCSPASLKSVGRVVTAWLSLPKPRRR